MANRKMRKGKSVHKPLAAPTKVFSKTPKRPANEDMPGYMKGGKQPGKLRTHKQRERRLKGVVI